MTGGDRREGGQVGEGEILVNRRVDHSEVTQEVLADLKNAILVQVGIPTALLS